MSETISEQQQIESELLAIVRKRSFKLGDFILSSGKPSKHYFDMKPTMMNARGSLLAAEAFFFRVRALDADYVGGLEMGAVPIISSLATVSEMRGHPINTFFVRKTPKVHGTKKVIEGLAESDLLRGKIVVIADDVTTSGKSSMKAVEAARGEGAIVKHIISLVDREEGAEEFLRHEGITLLPVFRKRDFD